MIAMEDGNNAGMDPPDGTRHHGDASQQHRTIVPLVSAATAPLAGTLSPCSLPI